LFEPHRGRSRLLYGRLADLVLLTHLAFIVFVTLGGLAALRWPRVSWAHVPCLAYGIAIELVGWVCPLTPLERHLRRLAGQEGYAGGFIEHYAGALVYPADWGALHVWFGLALLAFNVVVYVLVLRRVRRKTRV
ncbi:MAG TPA: DUF2784 domain-containing protein, partial [Longimicrobiales bacterium]|nr:DUF2784 domain-containing protein [Longimicrobiales bacterium]